MLLGQYDDDIIENWSLGLNPSGLSIYIYAALCLTKDMPNIF